ncbi:MAG: sodium/proline symporter [Candidatus Endobugula sp.]|jgi:sodium/proline symporter
MSIYIYIYINGLSAIWILLGFLFGDALVFYSIHQKVREETDRLGSKSFIDLISRWHRGDYSVTRVTISIISLVFLLTYSAAQFNAGGKALYAIFGWHYYLGSLICALLILTYCLKGGLRASIWTDAAQAIVMLLALIMLLFSVIIHTKGLTPLLQQLQDISPNYLSLGVEKFGSLSGVMLFAMGWIFNGIGVTGQPHIMVRFMALDNASNINKTGAYYFIWSVLFLFLILMISLSARIFIDPQAISDTELVLPRLAQLLLPSVAIGFILGGIFASIVSTTDSQILSCSAIISEDLKLGKTNQHRYIITFGVTLTALFISLFAPTDVFTLVIFSWSALACTMGPLVIVQACGQRPPQWLTLAMIAAGLSTALIWRAVGLSGQVYEALPGIMAGIIVFFIGSLFIQHKD